MHLRNRIVWIFALLVCTSASAQTTGSISGRIVGPDGAPLPGVLVSVSGTYLPAGRNMTTESDGAFAFKRLLPGPYDIRAELAGLGTASRRAIVEVDKDTQTNLRLAQTVSEQITVTAATPVIDVKSTEISRNFTSEVIERLPISRSYTGLFQLAPGVADNGRASFVAGGSFQDNRYLADGITINNPWFSNSVPNLSGVDIQEVNIKRGAITAEFGSSFGMVVNAVTKSGTNDLSGMVRYEYAPADFVEDPKGTTGSRDQTDRTTAGFSIGGPIIRDRAWYYGSISMPRDTTTNRRNNLGIVPDRDDDTDEYFVKLTANPLSNHFFSGSWRMRDTETTNVGITSNAAPSVGRTDTGRYELMTAGWVWNITSNSFVDLKGNLTDDANDLQVHTDLGHRPTPFDVTRLEQMGEYQNPQGQTFGGYTDRVNSQNYFRREARGTFQTTQNWFGISHDLRAGMSFDDAGENLARLSNGWGNIIRTTSGGQPVYRARVYVEQPEHRSHVTTWGVFLQDQLGIGERTTVNAGVLVNRQEIFGGGAMRLLDFDWGQMIQPRLGVSFVPSLQTHDKVYANFGRYHNLSNLSIGRAWSQSRLYRTDFFFDLQGNLTRTAPQSSTRAKRIVPGLDPMYTDEWVAGYARPLGGTWSAEVWGMYRSAHDFLEDMPNDLTGPNQPGFKGDQLPDAKRNYEAVTLELNRAATDSRWLGLTLNASYTWSKLYGNWDLDFVGPTVGQFYNSSLLQDGPGLNITDNRLGILQGDRTHVAKVFAAVRPLPPLTVGTYVRYQSGIPWEPRAFEATESARYFRYLEPAGSRRSGDWFNVDLLTSYDIGLGGLGELEIEARVINVLDEQVAITIDDRVINDQTWRASGDPGNPTFGKPSSYSTPRSFTLSATVRF